MSGQALRARHQHVHRFVEAADGQQIAARFFGPQGKPRASVLIVPAMGCSQEYYRPFASWLAAQGFTVATFDYRGTGLSRPSTLRGFKANIFDWARLDCAAMIDALPARPLYWIGHSLGGQILGLVPNRESIAKAVTVATGSGYWRENTARIRPLAWWLWFVVTPLALSLCGYFPGRKLRKVGDLPKGVMQQWRRWCLDPEYAVGAEGGDLRALRVGTHADCLALVLRRRDDVPAQHRIDPRLLQRGAAHHEAHRAAGHRRQAHRPLRLLQVRP